MASATRVTQAIRNFLIGKTLKISSRYPYDQAPRTQPYPNLPDGPAHKLGNNYYCDRDVRRASMPPVILYGQQKMLSGEEEVKSLTAKTPGKVFDPDED
ncbi:hypothetical protein ACROYT_G044550 [Oculina patagonica]